MRLYRGVLERKVYESENMILWEEVPPQLPWWDRVLLWLWFRGLWPS